MSDAHTGRTTPQPAPKLEETYRVRFDEAGPDGFLRSSGYLRWAQDMAWRHSESAGFGRDWYAEQRITWLIRAAELDIVAELEHGSTVTVSTEVIGFRRVWARRRSEFRDTHAGRIHATALIDWVLLNERAAPVRVPESIVGRFPTPAATFSPLRVELGPSPRDASSRELAVRRSELDPLNHVNNAAYLDYVDEHLAAGGRDDVARTPRRYGMEFVRAAEPAMELLGRAWPDEHGWRYLLTDTGGREVLRARLDTDRAAWVGA